MTGRIAQLQANEDCESTCDAVPGPSCASSPVGEYKLPLSASTPVKENVSARKLKNSSFEEIEREHGIMTRKKATRVGLRSSSQVGFKLHDPMLLNECISTAAICTVCRKAGSKLQLFRRNTEREGLSESFEMFILQS